MTIQSQMDARDADIGTVIDASRIERVMKHGALLLDVDDTLLVRERAVGGGSETFADSPSAALLPQLLDRGVRLCLITGHGWQQLETRLIAPLIEHLQSPGSLKRLSIYANRGATKILWDGSRHVVDEAYGVSYQLRAGELKSLSDLFNSLADEFRVDFDSRADWYRKTFPRFDFTSLPATVTAREGALLVLRPVPTAKHAESATAIDVRDRLYERGLELLEQAGFTDDYEIARSGRSSIEITRRGVSKEVAVRDLIAGIVKSSRESPSLVEESMVYVGDEFFPGGNDYELPALFPTVIFLSVSGEGAPDKLASGVISLEAVTRKSGPAATEVVLRHFAVSR